MLAEEVKELPQDDELIFLEGTKPIKAHRNWFFKDKHVKNLTELATVISTQMSPESSQKTNVFGTVHIDGRWALGWAVRLFVWPLIRKVANQDRNIRALQAANIRRFPDRKNAVTPFDIVRRRVLARWDVDFIDSKNDIADSETLMSL